MFIAYDVLRQSSGLLAGVGTALTLAGLTFGTVFGPFIILRLLW